MPGVFISAFPTHFPDRLICSIAFVTLDLETETVLPLSQASAHPLLRQGRRRGRPINRSTLERWRTRGVRGPGGERVILETVLIGAGIRATTVEALERFFAKLNSTDPADGGTPSQLRRQHEHDDAELVADGMR